MWRKGNSLALFVGMQTGVATMENCMEVPQKELPYDPAIIEPGTYLKDTKMLIQRGTCTLMFIAALSTIAKLWKKPKCPSTGEWIKMWFIYTVE